MGRRYDRLDSKALNSVGSRKAGRRFIDVSEEVNTSGEDGFTLIEVLIAVFLTAVLLTSIYYTFFSMLESREVISEELERQRELRRVVDVLGMELEAAYISRSNTKAKFSGSETTIKGNPEKFSLLEFAFFAHTTVSKDSPAGDLKVVKYSVGVGDSGRTDLFKEKWDAYIGQGGKGSFKVEAVEGIKSFKVTYFNGTTWSRTWSDTTAPDSVKVEIIIAKGSGTETYAFTAKPKINVTALGIRNAVPPARGRRRPMRGGG